MENILVVPLIRRTII